MLKQTVRTQSIQLIVLILLNEYSPHTKFPLSVIDAVIKQGNISDFDLD